MSTNMTPEEMSAIIKTQLADMPDWKIERQAIKERTRMNTATRWL
ncbi:MAG: hypothetical protein ACLRWH_03875 [Emergencia sp.]